MTSLKRSLKDTVWSRHSRKINLWKNDISQQRLHHSRSWFSKKLSELLEVEKLISFSLIHMICWRLPYCLNVVDFRAVTSSSYKTVLRHTAQRDATVSTTEHFRLHSCWWMGIIFSRSYSFRLLHLGYPAGFDVWRPTSSVCKSTGPQKGNQKHM